MLSEYDLFSASYIMFFTGFYFEDCFKPGVLFIQLDDVLTHMLDVFDEHLENKSESSAQVPQNN